LPKNHLINRTMKIAIKDRTALAEYFAELGFKRGAEIGVLAGSFSAILCQVNPALELYCIDSWGMGDVKMHNYHSRMYEKAKQKLSFCNATLIRKRSMDAVGDFRDNSLDFVHIDANHSFGHVTDDITKWSMKVKTGGIVSGHDYNTAPGVKEAVDAYTTSRHLTLHLATELDNGVISWWFVNK